MRIITAATQAVHFGTWDSCIYRGVVRICQRIEFSVCIYLIEGGLKCVVILYTAIRHVCPSQNLHTSI